jgi:CheY-like chemotaxis protein
MDDEEPLRRLIPDILEPLGFTVDCASSGEEAIALYQTAASRGARFDAVVLDLTVRGGMGGVETARRLKEIDPKVALIVSSGYSDDPVLSRYRDYGFQDVIPKPWVSARFASVVARVVESRRI